jgi:hypothetical protein
MVCLTLHKGDEWREFSFDAMPAISDEGMEQSAKNEIDIDQWLLN